MSYLVRFGVSIDHELLENFDDLVTAKRFANRSEAIRTLIRDHLVELKWREEDVEAVGTVTIVFNHKLRELTEKLTGLQHRYHGPIISSLHVHLDEHNCLEVLVVRGKTSLIKAIADELIGIKGVKHGQLTMTITGKDLA